MAALVIEVEPALRGRVRLGATALDDVEPGGGGSGGGGAAGAAGGSLDRAIAEAEREARERHHGLDPSGIEGLEPARRLYRSLGIDPTKHRPSSEALLRRVLGGKGLPRVGPIVDALNVCSLELLVPFGLYDRDRIEGERVLLRAGAPGEGYAGIRKEHVSVEGRPALCDAAGPFGNPTSDSARTAIGKTTRRILAVAFLFGEVRPEEARGVLEALEATLGEHVGGRVVWRAVVPG